MRHLVLLYWLGLRSLVETAVALSTPAQHTASAKTRRQWLRHNILLSSFIGGTSWWKAGTAHGSSDDMTSRSSQPASKIPDATTWMPLDIAYKTVALPLPEFGAQVPVACWFPASDPSTQLPFQRQLKYQHRISVRRIGELLAGWDFIPEFASRNFTFFPTTPSKSLRNGDSLPFQPGSKVVILSHGYLGSRFDLSHIAEDLASKGFVCVSPEYPESLAASYRRQPGLDRNVVNGALLKFVDESLQPSAYGVVGHSLGCGTALRIGDES